MSVTLREFIEARITARQAEAKRWRETKAPAVVVDPRPLGNEHPFMIGAFISMWGSVLERADREAKVLHDILVDYDRHHHD